MFISSLCLRVTACSRPYPHTRVAPFSCTAIPNQLPIATAIAIAVAGSHGRSHVRQPKRMSRCFPRVISRGARTKVTVKVEDLPQGSIPQDAVPLEHDTPTYPTVVLQARANMRKFDNCILLTRVGGFYELYFEQAEEVGPLLNLKVARKKTNAGSVPMVGILIYVIWL